MIRHFAIRRRKPFVNLCPTQANVICAKEGQSLSRRTITPASANFLVIGLNRFWQIRMGHPTNIRLIHPHAKGNRGHDDQTILLLKPCFDNPAIFGIHTTMIKTSRMPRFAQRLCQSFRLGPRAAIDDT